MSPLGDIAKGKILSSWKEIAGRLGVTVRTVQRWEKIGGLPIHRRGSGKTGRTYAHTAELDRWLMSGGPDRCAPEDAESRRPVRRRWFSPPIAGSFPI